MEDIRKKISDYIDCLNAEKKPEEHENPIDSPEMDELMNTVRLIRTMKEPDMPEKDYHKRLAGGVAKKMSEKRKATRRKFAWLSGIGAVAAMVVVVFVVSLMLPLGSNRIVNAMDEAFKEVKAYHGVLEIVQTNADGEETLQAKREVWVDREGYYIKELQGFSEGLITVNNGQKKWQVRPDEKKVYVFATFPDPYRFTFELGKEIEHVKNALSTEVVGQEVVSGRKAYVLEVTPKGGQPYRLWIDKETRLPLQKESPMQNAIQYRIVYTEIEFMDSVPGELLAYKVPEGFDEVDTNPELLVGSMEEAGEIAGFAPIAPKSLPEGYKQDGIAVAASAGNDANGPKIVRLYYSSQDGESKVVVIQGKAADAFRPNSMAILGKVGNNTAEIQSPVTEEQGVLSGGGIYAGVTGMVSIRWQKDELEFAVVGNVSLEELASFVEKMTGETVEIPEDDHESSMKPQVEVPVDMEVEENEQKSVDAGHSPWKLDPVYVAQVFVSLKISPEGIQGDYPVKYEEFVIEKNTGTEAIIQVTGDVTPVRRVYLKKLVRQDETGIWTVVGYDPADGE